MTGIENLITLGLFLFSSVAIISAKSFQAKNKEERASREDIAFTRAYTAQAAANTLAINVRLDKLITMIGHMEEFICHKEIKPLEEDKQTIERHYDCNFNGDKNE